MSVPCIYDILDQVLPNAGKSKHDIFRLEYISACKIMENKGYIVNILQLLPPRIYKSLLQSVIYNCYLKFINSLDISRRCTDSSLCDIDIPFPETLVILVLNWPYKELVLRDQIPSLEPPVHIFPSEDGQLVSQTHTIAQVEDMLSVYNHFCNRLVQFITDSVFKCTQATNTQGMAATASCKLSLRLDVTVLVHDIYYRYE